MKNIFKLLAVAFVASTMFVACGDDEKDNDVKTYTITATVNDEAMGRVSGAGAYDEGATCTLTATPNTGYTFVKWSDDNTENPRSFVVNSDLNLVAIFAQAESTRVTFNANSWEANTVNTRWYADDGIADVYACVQEGSYPIADACYAVSGTGMITDAIQDNGAYANNTIQWLEYYESTYMQDNNGNNYGDWWAKAANINVTAFDATALTLAFNAEAVMFHATEAMVQGGVSINEATTADLTMNSNVTLSTSKAKFQPKKWSK
jgi:hypothetical protein